MTETLESLDFSYKMLQEQRANILKDKNKVLEKKQKITVFKVKTHWMDLIEQQMQLDNAESQWRSTEII